MSLLVCVTVAFSCIRIALFVVYIYMYELHQVETAIVESVELMEEKFTFFSKSLSPFSQWHPAKFTVDGIPAPPPPLINGGEGLGTRLKGIVYYNLVQLTEGEGLGTRLHIRLCPVRHSDVL